MVHTFIQMLASWLEATTDIANLKRTLRIKSGLRHVGRAMIVLSVLHPVALFQGWMTEALWSRRAWLLGKGFGLAKRWFDKKVDSSMKELILATISAAVMEKIFKLLRLCLALFV